MPRWLTENLVLTGLCLLTGWLATFTGQPPSLEMAIWPPIGLGVVAVLVRGYRLLPGVWLPHFLIVLVSYEQYTPWVGDLEAIVGAALIGGGHVVHAAIGAWVIRRLVGYPTKLCRPREIAWFLLAVGPLSAVISTTIFTTVLCEAQVRTWSEFSSSWVMLIWEDIAGGVVFGVLALTLIAHPREVWRPRVRTVVAPLLVVILLMGLGVMVTGLVGTLLTLLLAALLLSVTGQTALIAEQVALRTAELQEEVSVRSFTEAVLRTTTDRLAIAQQIANLGHMEWNVELDEVYLSTELQELLGIQATDSEQSARSLFAHIHADDLQEVEDAIATAKQRSQPVPIEIRMIRIDGEIRWVALSLSAVAFESGRRIHGTVLDITLQKMASVAIQDAEARQRLALAAGGMGTLIWDVGTPRMTWDARLQSMLGLTNAPKGDGVKAFLAAIHPADRDKVKQTMALVDETAVPAGQGDCESEFRVVLPDGTVRWVHSRGRVIRDDDDGPSQLFSLVFDVTARRQAEEILRASEARLAESQRIAKLGSWDCELSTQRVWWSAEMFHMLGRVPQAEPMTIDFVMGWMHPDDRDRVTEQLASAARLGQPLPEFEARYSQPNGEYRWFRALAQLTLDETGPTWIKGVSQDITEQKLADEQRRKFEDNLQQTQRLESLGILAGGIAHDFNNLLTGMLGNASLAREVIPPDSELHEYLRPIEKSAEHAAHLCQQMLAYAGKGATVRGPLDLNELIHESSDLVKLAASRKANLQVEYGADLPPVIGDTGQLRQVLLNLIQNASEALGAESGSVTIRTRTGKAGLTVSDEVTWSGEPPTGEYVCLEVTDTGCGMSPTTRARIFEPFFTTKFTGRGLGLSAVHGIVKHHGGAMRVKSCEGHGTTFGVYLPSGLNLPQLDTVAELNIESPTPTDTPLPVRKVALLADDEPSIRTLAGVALRALGFTVIEAPDGRVATELFQANPDHFTLAVLDLMMPELDGREVLASIRKLRPELPVVFVSGYSEYDLVDVLEDAHVWYVPKPFRPNDLTGCVRQLFQTPFRCEASPASSGSPASSFANVTFTAYAQ